MVDVLRKMLAKAVANDLIKGLCSDLLPSGVVCLQYAYDTIFIIKDDVESVENLKFILGAFEQMSGLKINFRKSERMLMQNGGTTH